MGLFGGIRAKLQERDDSGLSLGDRFGIFATLQNGDTAGAAGIRKGAANRVAQIQHQRLVGDLMDKLNLSDEQRFLYATNPDEFTKALSAQYAPANVDGGQTRMFGKGGQMVTAPKLVDHEGVYGTQTPTGYAQTGQAGPSVDDLRAAAADAEAKRHNMVGEGFDYQRVGLEKDRNDISRGQLGVAQGQLGVARGHLGVAQGKASAATGAPASSPTMDAIAAELRRRGALQ